MHPRFRVDRRLRPSLRQLSMRQGWPGSFVRCQDVCSSDLYPERRPTAPGTVIDYAPSVPGGSAIAAISTAIIDATGVAGLIAVIATGLLIIVFVLSGGGKSNYFFCARCDEYLGEMRSEEHTSELQSL